MNKTITIILSVVVVVLVLFGMVYVNTPKNPEIAASGFSNNDFYSTTTDSTFVIGTSCTNLKIGPGALGGLIVTKTSNAPLYLYDATSTLWGAYGTTTLMSFVTTTVGNYTGLNASFTKGLLLCMPSTVGVASTTITWN